MRLCKHCNIRQGTRSRGLCCRCFSDREIRQQYPFNRTDPAIESLIRQTDLKMPEPTSARQVTEEKIRVMEERALRGEFIFHHADGR